MYSRGWRRWISGGMTPIAITVRLRLCLRRRKFHLSTLIISEPTPHLQLFLFATTDIFPYESLRIRPPPEPPPLTLFLAVIPSLEPKPR